jgi:CheY-like chemotaxis protein
MAKDGNDAAQDSKKPVWLEVAKLIPQIGWLVLASFILYVAAGPLLRVLEQNAISKVGMAGVTIEFVQRNIAAAASAKSQDIPKALTNRIERTMKKMFEVSVMWLDDEPNVNQPINRALNSLGVTVDIALSTKAAMELLQKRDYAILISDLNRKAETETAPCYPGGEQAQPLDDEGRPIATAGCHFIREAKKLFDEKKQKMPPLIIYTSREFPADWGIPPYAFGSTIHVDQFFHLIMDVLERRPNT